MHKQAMRLYEAAKKLKGVYQQTEVARLLDTSSQVIKNWEARGISKGGILAAQTAIGCRAEWLEHGTGQMAVVTSHSSGLTPAFTDSPAPLWDTGSDFAVSAATMLPVFSWSETRKMLETGERPPDVGHDRQWLPSPFPTVNGDFFARWEGESMIGPDGAGYRDGSHLHISPSEPHRPGDDVLALMPSGRILFRRIKDSPDGPILETLNPAWPERIIAMPADAKVIAVVVGSTYRNRR